MTLPTPEGYRPLDESSLPAFLAELPQVAQRLGGVPADWTVQEVGDGNLNLVFLVDGPGGDVCVKQSLPYVRLVGEGWPMPLERAAYEAACLEEHGRWVGPLIPEVYHYDPKLFCIVMERLSPHIIMRQGMIKAIRYPRFADDLSTYCARSLFFTSDLGMPAPEKREKIARFSTNTNLCKITEDLIFTEPYMIAERNRWTTPQLDGIAAEYRNDVALKMAVSRLKLAFMGNTQALLHGDLHTGSVMITPENTRVIDPEFAFFGPMGFDLGAIIGNLLINYFSQDGHATPGDPRDSYQDWVLETVEAFWSGFARKFLSLWRDEAGGDGYPAPLFADAAAQQALEQERLAYMTQLWTDTVRFGSAKMIRRILGLAHNIDLEWIEDPDSRATCETRCLRLARELMLNTGAYRTVQEVTAAARHIRAAL